MVPDMAPRPALVCALIFLAWSAAPAAESPLSSGVPFPDLVGKSLAGADLTVDMRDGVAKVIVMTFTRGAATPAQTWLDACQADEKSQSGTEPSGAENSSAALPGRVACYDVRMVQGVPRLVRGFVEGRMKKGLGPEQLARTILVYKDKEAWRDRLLVMSHNEDQPFIVMVDRQGRVQSLLWGPFDPAALKAEQAKLVAR